MIDYRYLYKAKKIILVLLVVLSTILIAKGFFYSFKYGGTDLRCRVIGSRLMAMDQSPYFYKWKPIDGNYYLDPNDHRNRIVNGNVSTPAVLKLFQPLYQLPYSTVRIVWTVFLFIMTAASVALLRMSVPQKASYIPATWLVIITFLLSDIFLYNIERGQIYIFYTFLLSLIYFLFQRKFKTHLLLSGCIAGIFIFFRPTAILFCLPFLLARKTQWIAGALSGLAIGFIFLVMPMKAEWNSYLDAMSEYGAIMQGKGTEINLPKVQFPTVIEDVNNLTKYRHFEAGGLATVHSYLGRLGLPSNANVINILFGVIILILSFLYMRTQDSKETNNIFLFGFLLYLLAEVFIMAPRGGYNIIQWMFPVFIGWSYISKKLILLWLFGVAILFLHHFPFLFPFQNDIGELLLIVIVGMVLFNYKSAPQHPYTSP